MVKPIDTTQWYMMSLPAQWGDSASNNLNSTLGQQLASGLQAGSSAATGDKQAIFAFAGETRQELLALKDMIEAGDIAAVVDRVYLPEQASDAHRRVESEQRLGIVVIDISSL